MVWYLLSMFLTFFEDVPIWLEPGQIFSFIKKFSNLAIACHICSTVSQYRKHLNIRIEPFVQ